MSVIVWLNTMDYNYWTKNISYGISKISIIKGWGGDFESPLLKFQFQLIAMSDLVSVVMTTGPCQAEGQEHRASMDTTTSNNWTES